MDELELRPVATVAFPEKYGRALPEHGAHRDHCGGLLWIERHTRHRSNRDDLAAQEGLPGEFRELLRDLAAHWAQVRERIDACDARIRPDNADALAHLVTSPWARQAFNYDPIPTLRALRTPVLVLDGSRDLYVPPEDNLPAIKAALTGNPKATIVELPNINHMFQTAKIGTLAESARIEETISPVALKEIADWVVAQGS